MTATQLRRRSLLWFVLWLHDGNPLCLRASQIVDEQLKKSRQKNSPQGCTLDERGVV